MSLPLSLVGLAMSDAVLHCALPGDVSAGIFQWETHVKAIGYAAVGLLSTLVYAIAGVCNIFVSATDRALWIVGQFLVGVAWNLGFSTSSVMISTCTLPGQVKLGAKIQAYSDFISFLCGGLITISAGFIYDTGKSALVLFCLMYSCVQYKVFEIRVLHLAFMYPPLIVLASRMH